MVHTAADLSAFHTARDQGGIVEVDEELFFYYLEILPPVFMYRTLYVAGSLRRISFGFAEGAERITAFWEEGNRYFCTLTDERARG